MTAIDLSGNEQIEVLGAFGFSAIRSKMLSTIRPRPIQAKTLPRPIQATTLPRPRVMTTLPRPAQKCSCPRVRRARRARRLSRRGVIKRSMYNIRRRMPW